MGKFNTYLVNRKKGCILVRSNKNTLTVAGRRYLLDRILDTGTHNWDSLRISHLAVGTSTDSNGNTGPTASTPVPVSGPWKGPSPYDWQLAREILRGEASVRRTGEAVFITTRFTNASFNTYWAEYGTGSVPVVELGLFLSGTEPNGNPLVDTAEEANAMFARTCLITTYGTGYWIAEPIYKANDGTTLGVGYEINYEVP